MDADRFRRWLDGRAESFAAGRAHEENLAYLLGDDFRPARAWSQLLGCFGELVDAARQAHDVRRAQGIFFLVDSSDRRAPFPGMERLVAEQHVRPPSLVLLGTGDDRAWWARFDLREEPIDPPGQVPPGTTARYEVMKERGAPHDEPYRRSVTLEYLAR